MPVRVHSSGDFFSPEYARAWIELANQLPDLDFWAPTRTWASRGWNEFWSQNLRLARHGNFIVRPSAWHTGDPAISPTARMLPVGTDNGAVARPEKPWSGPYPFAARGRFIGGTTALYRADSPEPDRLVGNPIGHSSDPRCDWVCAAYANESDKHTCGNALAPDGMKGCRICWTDLETRICYTAH
jgi:hypothetical protein